MNTQTIQQTEIDTNVQNSNTVIEGIFRVTIGAFISFAGLTGLWAMAAVISALAKAGGPIGLARAWITAVTGV